MTPLPRVSVVVPAADEEALLPDCLTALARQDYAGEIEILVVDNASTDGTAGIARAAGVRVVEEPRRSYAAALRCGFAAATGEIIASTDADTVVPADWVRRLADPYAADDSVVCVGGGVTFADPNWKGWLFTRAVLPLLVWGDRHAGEGPHLWGASFSVRRDAFLRAGGFHPDFDLQVDTELSERMRRHGRVLLLDDLRVRSSARRWNRCLLVSSLLFASNYAWVRLFHRPLWHSFPSVREPARGARAPRWRWRHRLAAACLGLALVGGIGLLGYDAFAPWSNAFGTTYWYGPPRPKQIALTFDDGPEEPYTSEVLAILRREHVKATFFLIGENVRRFPETALRIVREGHVVANHSDTHPPALALDPEDVVRAEVDRAERTIHAVTGVYPHLFRPPQGIRSPWLLETLREDSLVAVTWDDAARDWERRSAADLERRAVAEATPGAIVLLHDGLNLDHHADRSSTVRALPEIIRRLRAEGYRFVTVPELLRQPAALARWQGERPVRRV